MESNVAKTLDITGDFDSCPNCGVNFLGKDIYQHFLENYTSNWPYEYALTKERILQSKSEYPDLYINFPDNLDSLTDIEANALYTAYSYGWHVNNKKCFRDIITGVEVPGYYDGAAFWHCTKCNTYWKRFQWSNLSIIEKWRSKDETISNNTDN